MIKSKTESVGTESASLFELLKPYSALVAALVFLTILANGLNLFVPKIIAGTTVHI